MLVVLSYVSLNLRAFWFRMRFDVFCIVMGPMSMMLGVRMFSSRWFVEIVCSVSRCIYGKSWPVKNGPARCTAADYSSMES